MTVATYWLSTLPRGAESIYHLRPTVYLFAFLSRCCLLLRRSSNEEASPRKHDVSWLIVWTLLRACACISYKDGSLLVLWSWKGIFWGRLSVLETLLSARTVFFIVFTYILFLRLNKQNWAEKLILCKSSPNQDNRTLAWCFCLENSFQISARRPRQ